MSQRLRAEMLLVRGSRRSKKSILTDFEILANKNLKLGTYTSKAQNGQKTPKYLKLRKMAKQNQKCHFFDLLAIRNSNTFGQGEQAIKKYHFFDVLAIGNSNAFSQGDKAIKKVNFERFRSFGQKKNLKLGTYIPKAQNGQKNPKYLKVRKSPKSNKGVIFLMSQPQGTQMLLVSSRTC